MKVSVAYARPDRQSWLHLEVPEGTTVRQAIERSGILVEFPEIDLESQKVGVFGRVVKLDDPVAEGNRVEIYRPIVADPKAAKGGRKGGGGDAAS